ncbi:MAG: bifunctional ornithine acetyltransferase/N-acetylglutamate synthase [Oscillospiraceae bacterium]|nr:bifunctional ornithine acetyltransferase/N-acetylglutamate synthase [Oscillospiraceae bacterium]
MRKIKFIEGGVTAPQGFLAAGIHCGLRKNKIKKDLALIFSKDGGECAAAAVYTTNKVFGAPITVTKESLENGKAKAVICNSGIANTCTPDGLEKAYRMREIVADILGIDKSDVIVASTGVIGASLPLEPIENGLPMLKDALGDTKEAGEAAAFAIMTTDTRKKEYAVEFEIDGGKTAKIGLIAKGSGMIEPNMATMLCFVTTDIDITPEMLQSALTDVVQDTFNMVSVDGDTSTNDMVSVMASGLCGNRKITDKDENYIKFRDALYKISEKVSKAIAFDGEGATKLLECRILNANSKHDAKKLAKSVIKSSLVKTLMFGADANWGRILCALGYSGVDFDPEKVDVKFKSSAGEITVCKDGGYTGVEVDEVKAKEILSRDIIEIIIDMRTGKDCAAAWGCDLSYEYVRINGDYRS